MEPQEPMSEAQETQKVLVEEAKRIKEALGLDSVEIVATYMDADESTNTMSGGAGNFHARTSSMRSVLIQRDEQYREHARRTYGDD